MVLTEHISNKWQAEIISVLLDPWTSGCLSALRQCRSASMTSMTSSALPVLLVALLVPLMAPLMAQETPAFSPDNFNSPIDELTVRQFTS